MESSSHPNPNPNPNPNINTDQSNNNSSINITTLQKKTKLKEFTLDYTKLEQDLQRELESDKRYWVQNEAKLRAVNNVGTYEDFRQIVLAAHLRPLDKKDKDSISPGAAMTNKVIWNNAVLHVGKNCEDLDKNHKNVLISASTFDLMTTTTPQNFPIRIEQFSSQWKKLDSDEGKFTFLLNLAHADHVHGPKKKKLLEHLFSDEVPVVILPEILEILEKQLQGTNSEIRDESEAILKILAIIANSKRFNFTQIFLALQDRQIISRIFTRIQELIDNMRDGNGDHLDFQKVPNKITHLFNTVKAQYNNLTD